MLAACSIVDLVRRFCGPGPGLLAPGRPVLSLKDLLDQIERTVASLNGYGLGPNDPVAIVLPNGPAMGMVFLGVSQCATAAPLNPAYTADEFDFYLGDLGAKALIVAAGSTSPAVAVARRRGIPVLEMVEVQSDAAGVFTLRGETVGPACLRRPAKAEDVALLLHTSGTTSRPKLVPLTHANLVAVSLAIGKAFALGPADRSLTIVPMFHIHGLTVGFLAPLAAGGSVVIPPGFDAVRFFEWFDEFEPTWYTAAPAFHQAILAQAPKAVPKRRRLRFIRSASASLPIPVMEALESLFEAPVIESYGMTEAGPQVTCNPFPPAILKPGTVGIPAGPEVAIMGPEGSLLAQGERGEVVIRGPNVMLGYAKNPDANVDAFCKGWFRTGDLGHFDSDGYLTLSGRIKEIINRGGEKVSPAEVDSVLMTHPAIAEALSFSIPHRTLGEEIAAVVVLRDERHATETEIREYALRHLAAFKVPRKIIFVGSIPTGPTGKPLRIDLAERLGLKDANSAGAQSSDMPVSGLEAAVAGVWRHVLKADSIGRDTDFFVSGGDSLQATQLILEVHGIFGVALQAETLVGVGATVAGMATEIERQRSRALTTVETGAGRKPRLDVDFAEFEQPQSAGKWSSQYFVDPRTGLRRATPNTTIGRARINAQGYRGPDIATPKPAATLRIAFMGGSRTFDTFVSSNDATWPNMTCEYLRASFPRAAIDYLNGGLPGFNTRQLIVLFREYLSSFNPDASVIWVNDLNADSMYLARNKGVFNGPHFQPTAMAKRSKKFAWIEKNTTIVARLLRAQTSWGKLNFEKAELTRGFEERLEELVRLCQSQCPVVTLITTGPQLRRSQSRLQRMRAALSNVFFMPYMSIEGILNAYAYDEAIHRVGQRTGALVIEAADAVPGDNRHFIDSTHYRDPGSERMAVCVADALSQCAAFRDLALSKSATAVHAALES